MHLGLGSGLIKPNRVYPMEDKTRLNAEAGYDTRGQPNTFFENQLLTYKQTAQYLSLSEPYLRKLKAKGDIPFVVVGHRAVRFRVSSLNQWIVNREVK